METVKIQEEDLYLLTNHEALQSFDSQESEETNIPPRAKNQTLTDYFIQAFESDDEEISQLQEEKEDHDAFSQANSVAVSDIEDVESDHEDGFEFVNKQLSILPTINVPNYPQEDRAYMQKKLCWKRQV